MVVSIPVTSQQFGNRVRDTRSYDLQGRLQTLDIGNVENRLYGYDANGNVEDFSNATGLFDYGYDELDRLTLDSVPSIDVLSLQYDENGNRELLTQGASSTDYIYTPNTNLLDDIGGTLITHDGAGNRTSDRGGARTFEYNDAGRLFQVFDTGVLTATYTYNALGQRL